MNKIITIFFSTFFLACSSYKTSANSCDITSIIDHFIAKGALEPVSRSVIVIYVSDYKILSKGLHLLTIMEFEKSMYLDYDEANEIRDYGLYNYKGFELSLSSNKNIDISPMANCLIKINDKGFKNEGGIVMSYNPFTMKFIVNDKMNYIHTYFAYPPKYKDKKDTEELRRNLNK